MQSQTFGNFQIGMMDNPSVEDKGGFEFAAGMDIFSEPGVMKASYALAEVTYGTGAAPTAVPYWSDITADSSSVTAYIAAGTKLLQSTDNGQTWSVFITAGYTILGLKVWNGYVLYAGTDRIGRVQVGNAGTQNDNFLTGLDSDDEFHPMIQQAGTVKVGAGRYIASIDEAFAMTAQAMKLPVGYRVRSLAEYFTNLYAGTQLANPITEDASVFAWRGTVLSSGSALPDTPYPIKLRGMNALIGDGRRLYGFPDNQGDILQFDGAGFVQFRKLYALKTANGVLFVKPGAVAQSTDNIILFAGNGTAYPGVFAMKDGALCQPYVPASMTPGSIATVTVGMINTSMNGAVIIGYYNGNNSSYHIEKQSSDRQNGALVKTVWHRMKTDKMKRWGGIKLNLKPMDANTSVAVAYRTSRSASFTDSGYTITSANQDKPVIFGAQPRSRELQFRLTYTTNAASTPELLSYDPLFEILKTIR